MFKDIVEIYDLVIYIFFNGGWVIFAWGLVYMFYKLYMDHINIRWYKEQTWVFLKITTPRDNEKSPLTFEHVFGQMHATHSTFSFAEKYIDGKFQIWFAWEVTSIGGAIGNYVRIIKNHRNTLEAAIYSQFPKAEITETEDYFDKLPKYNQETSDYDIYAFSMVLKKEDAYPIRSYLDFEHSSADTFVDPVEGLWEELGKINTYEMVVVQYMFQPVDDHWKEGAKKLIDKLKGMPEKKEGSRVAEMVGTVTNPLLDIVINPTPSEGAKHKKEEPPSMWMHMSEGQKAVVTAIERNISKLGFKTKIRYMYIAPKEKYNPSPVRTAVVGSFKSLGAWDLNSLKPDTDHWTQVKYFLFKDWEKPIHDLRLQYRKRHFMHMIRTRWFLHGPRAYVLNIEEIATILHFPRITVTAPQIEKVSVTKVQPPPELPVAE